MKKHRKNKKITLIKKITEINEVGDEVLKDIIKKEVWADYRHISAKEINSIAPVDKLKISVIFEIRNGIKVDSEMEILYNGEIYKIFYIDDYEGNRTDDIKIHAYKIGLQEIK